MQKDTNYKYSVDKEINKRRIKDENNIKVYKQIKEYDISFSRFNVLGLGASSISVELLSGYFAIKL